MATQIPLPKRDDLPKVVLFHRSHPSDQRLLLQVPVSQDDAETYVVRLDHSDHREWMRRLPNSKQLLDLLTYEMHVSYYPQNGGCVLPLEDPDQVPWIRKAFAMAHQRFGASALDRRFARRRNMNRGVMASPLRHALGLRPGGATW